MLTAATVVHILLLLMIFEQPISEATLLEKNTALTKEFPIPYINHNEEAHQYSSSNFLCINSSYNCAEIKCSNEGPLLIKGYCATYNEETRLLSITNCPYFQSNGYNINITIPGYIKLPRNLSHLNDYMCGPLNRKGIVCSECADGFSPSVTSFGYKCANCTDAWYGVPLFLVVKFVPITLFYLIILVFQISVTSAPMPCFVMYAQGIVVASYMCRFSEDTLREIIYAENGNIRLDMKIIGTIYGFLNLDFFDLILPPFCVSEHAKSIHLAFSGYILVFYPIVLIFLTWVCIELHGRNFRPLVWLWRPFHRCFVRLRRGWDTKSDIIDVFATFLFLSYSKSLLQTFMFLSIKHIRSYNESGISTEVYTRTAVDLTVTFWSMYHYSYLIPAILCFIVYNIVPLLLLTFYPFKVFRLCLSKCRLNFIAINIFVEKVNGCYRDGLDGGRDMRSLSGFYLLLRMIVALVGLLTFILLNMNRGQVMWIFKFVWIPIGTVLMIAALMIALIRPYRKSYMVYLDCLLLTNVALICYVMRSDIPAFLIVRILVFAPITTLILTVTLTKVLKIWKQHKPAIKSNIFFNLSCCKCCRFLLMNKATRERRSSVIIQSDDSEEEQLPYIQPKSSEIT